MAFLKNQAFVTEITRFHDEIIKIFQRYPTEALVISPERSQTKIEAYLYKMIQLLYQAFVLLENGSPKQAMHLIKSVVHHAIELKGNCSNKSIVWQDHLMSYVILRHIEKFLTHVQAIQKNEPLIEYDVPSYFRPLHGLIKRALRELIELCLGIFEQDRKNTDDEKSLTYILESAHSICVDAILSLEKSIDEEVGILLNDFDGKENLGEVTKRTFSEILALCNDTTLSEKIRCLLSLGIDVKRRRLVDVMSQVESALESCINEDRIADEELCHRIYGRDKQQFFHYHEKFKLEAEKNKRTWLNDLEIEMISICSAYLRRIHVGALDQDMIQDMDSAFETMASFGAISDLSHNTVNVLYQLRIDYQKTKSRLMDLLPATENIIISMMRDWGCSNLSLITKQDLSNTSIQNANKLADLVHGFIEHYHYLEKIFRFKGDPQLSRRIEQYQALHKSLIQHHKQCRDTLYQLIMQILKQYTYDRHQHYLWQDNLELLFEQLSLGLFKSTQSLRKAYIDRLSKSIKHLLYQQDASVYQRMIAEGLQFKSGQHLKFKSLRDIVQAIDDSIGVEAFVMPSSTDNMSKYYLSEQS